MKTKRTEEMHLQASSRQDPCAQHKQIGPVDVNRSVHTARKQHQRICICICARSSCVDEATRLICAIASFQSCTARRLVDSEMSRGCTTGRASSLDTVRQARMWVRVPELQARTLVRGQADVKARNWVGGGPIYQGEGATDSPVPLIV